MEVKTIFVPVVDTQALNVGFDTKDKALEAGRKYLEAEYEVRPYLKKLDESELIVVQEVKLEKTLSRAEKMADGE